MIGEDKVLTVAHNVCRKMSVGHPIADKVYFLLGVNGVLNINEAIPVASFDYAKNFCSISFEETNALRSNDYAVLTLS